MIRTQLVCPLSSMGAEEAALVAAGCRSEGKESILSQLPFLGNAWYFSVLGVGQRLWVCGYGTNRSFPRHRGWRWGMSLRAGWHPRRERLALEWPVRFLFSGAGVGSVKGQPAAEQGWGQPWEGGPVSRRDTAGAGLPVDDPGLWVTPDSGQWQSHNPRRAPLL